MRISIEATPKEIAALVLELQERRGCVDAEEVAENVIQRILEQRDKVMIGFMSDQSQEEKSVHTLTMDEVLGLRVKSG